MGEDLVGANLGDRLRLALGGLALLRSRPATMATITDARLRLSIMASLPTRPATDTGCFARTDGATPRRRRADRRPTGAPARHRFPAAGRSHPSVGGPPFPGTPRR